MKTTALLLFFSGMYCIWLYSNSTIEPELLVLGLISILSGLFLLVEEIGKDLNLINNNQKNESWL